MNTVAAFLRSPCSWIPDQVLDDIVGRLGTAALDAAAIFPERAAMQFLKTLFWVVVAVVAVLFFYTNWLPVTLKLWGGLEVDVKIPVLFSFAFLLGFLPTFLVYRARLWSLKRRYETQATAHVVSHPAPARPVTPASNNPDRQAKDAKAWPAG